MHTFFECAKAVTSGIVRVRAVWRFEDLELVVGWGHSYCETHVSELAARDGAAAVCVEHPERLHTLATILGPSERDK